MRQALVRRQVVARLQGFDDGSEGERQREREVKIEQVRSSI